MGRKASGSSSQQSCVRRSRRSERRWTTQPTKSNTHNQPRKWSDSMLSGCFFGSDVGFFFFAKTPRWQGQGSKHNNKQAVAGLYGVVSRSGRQDRPEGGASTPHPLPRIQCKCVKACQTPLTRHTCKWVGEASNRVRWCSSPSRLGTRQTRVFRGFGKSLAPRPTRSERESRRRRSSTALHSEVCR